MNDNHNNHLLSPKREACIEYLEKEGLLRYSDIDDEYTPDIFEGIVPSVVPEKPCGGFIG